MATRCFWPPDRLMPLRQAHTDSVPTHGTRSLLRELNKACRTGAARRRLRVSADFSPISVRSRDGNMARSGIKQAASRHSV